jgi:hypothetical protein
MIERTVKTQIQLTADELAKEFCQMSELEQAKFFNQIEVETKKWDYAFCFQLQAVANSGILTEGGRNVMNSIGEYSKVR